MKKRNMKVKGFPMQQFYWKSYLAISLDVYNTPAGKGDLVDHDPVA